MVKQVKRILPLKCFLAIDSIDSFAISAKHANVAYNCGKLTVLNILTKTCSSSLFLHAFNIFTNTYTHKK